MQTKHEINTFSAVRIQTSIRGFFARQNYHLTHQAIGDCTSYELNLKGNDPEIILPTLIHSPEDKPVLIGTSGLRSLEIACKLGGNCPKIFLIDNSLVVIQFWRDLQFLMRGAQNAKGILSSFLPTALGPKCFARLGYLEYLSDKYGFETVKNIILNASIIRQDWAHEKTFRVIGNLIKHHQYKGVYVYPSNIVAYINHYFDEEYAKSVLRNIECLNPDLAIHTDLVLKGGGVKPQDVFYVAKGNHKISSVFNDLTRGLTHSIQKSHVVPISFGSFVKNNVVYISILVEPEYGRSVHGFFNRVSPDDTEDKKVSLETFSNLAC